MGKNYARLFKIEPSINNALSYIVYRRNFSDKFQKVAEAKIIPGERLEINYSKDLRNSDKAYVEEFLNTLVRLKIKPSKKGSSDYNIYRTTSSGELERVAIATSTTGYEIYCIASLTPNETAYLENYFRQLLKQKSNK